MVSAPPTDQYSEVVLVHTCAFQPTLRGCQVTSTLRRLFSRFPHRRWLGFFRTDLTHIQTVWKTVHGNASVWWALGASCTGELYSGLKYLYISVFLNSAKDVTYLCGFREIIKKKAYEEDPPAIFCSTVTLHLSHPTVSTGRQGWRASPAGVRQGTLQVHLPGGCRLP